MNIAVFASGKGTNFQAIAEAVHKGFIKARLSLLVCDTPGAPVVQKAQRAQVPVFLIERKSFSSLKEFENRIIKALWQEKIDLIVLAGFMRILSPAFVAQFKGRMLNIHPSLLPSFKGTRGIQEAFRYGVKVTGVTVHFVDEHVDHGPIILQSPLPLAANETLASLERKIHALEHTLYPQAVKLFTEGKLRIKGRVVRVATQ